MLWRGIPFQGLAKVHEKTLTPCARSGDTHVAWSDTQSDTNAHARLCMYPARAPLDTECTLPFRPSHQRHSWKNFLPHGCNPIDLAVMSSSPLIYASKTSHASQSFRCYSFTRPVAACGREDSNRYNPSEQKPYQH